MRLMLLAALAAFAAGPALAEDFTDPVKLLEAVYAQYSPTVGFSDPDFTRTQQSKRLNALYDADAAEANGEIGRIDFDPYVNGQDFDIQNLSIEPPYYAGGKALVKVTFTNFGSPQDLGVLLVKEGEAWKIDDLFAASPDYSYDLLDILQAPLN